MTQNSVSPAVSPSLGYLIKLSLRVLIRPTGSVFRSGSQANGLFIGTQLAVWITSSVLLGWLYRLLNPIHLVGSTHALTNRTISINIVLLQKLSLANSLGMIVLIPVAFLIDVGIIYGLARRAGGVASFREQCASMLLFLAPLGIFCELVAFVPYVGALAIIACIVYGLILQMNAVSAVHNLTKGQALGTVLVPLVVFFVLSCVLSVAIIAALLTTAK